MVVDILWCVLVLFLWCGGGHVVVCSCTVSMVCGGHVVVCSCTLFLWCGGGHVDTQHYYGQ